MLKNQTKIKKRLNKTDFIRDVSIGVGIGFFVGFIIYSLYLIGLFSLVDFNDDFIVNNIKQNMPYIYSNTTKIFFTTKKIEWPSKFLNKKYYLGTYLLGVNIIIINLQNYDVNEIELTAVHEFAHRYYLKKLNNEDKLLLKKSCNCSNVNEYYARMIEKQYKEEFLT